MGGASNGAFLRLTLPLTLPLLSIALSLLSPAALAADPTPGASFGPRGFAISDASGANVLNLGLSFQPRLTATFSGDPDATDADAVADAGLRVRRMLFLANGTLAGRIDWRFRINAANSFAFTDADGKSQLGSKPILDDAQLVFRIAEPFQIAAGQWKVPFTLSQAMGDTSLLFPDRPLPIDGFKYGDIKLDGLGWSRDAGVAALGSAAEKRVEYAVGVFNGDGTNVWPGDDGQLIAGRVQVAPLGEFRYDEVDTGRGPLRLGIGASGSLNTHPLYNDSGAATDPQTILRASGELRLSVAGLSVQGEAIYGATSAPGEDDLRSLGAYAQIGYCLPVGVAPGLRWARLDPSMDAEDDGVTQVEGVVNWYLPDPAKPDANLGHKAQLQLAWTTSLADGADDPLSHQIQLATAVSF